MTTIRMICLFNSRNLLPAGNIKRSPLLQFPFHREISTVVFHDLFNDGQPDAGAFIVASAQPPPGESS